MPRHHRLVRSSGGLPSVGRLRMETGITSTEVAIVMPAMLIVILFVFQVALFWHAKQAADVAAEEAVDAAQVADATEADGVAGANTILSQAGNLRNATVSVTRDPATGLVTATVAGEAPSIIPFGSWSVRAASQAPIEEFRSVITP